RRLAADAGGAGGAAALVSVEMLACDHLARRIEPHHLTEARPGSAEMWQGHSARLVVGRQMPELAALSGHLADGGGGGEHGGRATTARQRSFLARCRHRG